MKTDGWVTDRELRRMNSDGNSACSSRKIVSRESTLPTLVELPPGC
jgi:hypothetical protein